MLSLWLLLRWEREHFVFYRGYGIMHLASDGQENIWEKERREKADISRKRYCVISRKWFFEFWKGIKCAIKRWMGFLLKFFFEIKWQTIWYLLVYTQHSPMWNGKFKMRIRIYYHACMHRENEKEVFVERTRRRSFEAFDGRSFCRSVVLFTVTSNVHMFTFVCIHSHTPYNTRHRRR